MTYTYRDTPGWSRSAQLGADGGDGGSYYTTASAFRWGLYRAAAPPGQARGARAPVFLGQIPGLPVTSTGMALDVSGAPIVVAAGPDLSAWGAPAIIAAAVVLGLLWGMRQ